MILFTALNSFAPVPFLQVSIRSSSSSIICLRKGIIVALKTTFSPRCSPVVVRM